MKNVKFYLEYSAKKDKRKATRKDLGNHSGNVLAVFGDWFKDSNGQFCKECEGGIQDFPNSPVCSTSVSDTYFKENCKRISEKQAREIHPNLFNFLDSCPE